MSRLRLPALLLAVAGYWLPWLTHPAAALRLNGYELSEWITFLPGVRDGTLALSRLQFFLPLAGLALLCALVATRPASRLALPPLGVSPRTVVRPPRSGLAGLLPPIAGLPGWIILLAGLLFAFVVLPPYPYLLTAYADLEYRTQLIVAVMTLLTFIVLVYLPGDLNTLLQLIVAVAAFASAIPPLLAVRSAADGVLGAVWSLGLGWPLLLVGLGMLALFALARLFGPRT